MKMGLIGLGRMGNAIGFRLVEAGHTVIGFDRDTKTHKAAQEVGITLVNDLEKVAQETRVIWLMIPIGVVDDVILQLVPHLKAGDIIIDGGNSFYKDSMRRAQALALQGIIFLDCGTSGGVEGRSYGFCLMVGGDEDAYVKIHSLLVAIARPGGIGYIGPSGTGHYVKMIHNGIEYGLLQAYAEGFQVIKEGTFKKLAIDLEELSRIWNVSSIIRSFLLELTHEIFKEDQEFHTISGEIEEGGTGRWTMEQAEQHKIPVPLIKQAVETRSWSQKSGGNYATKLIALLRHKFGGHPVKMKKD
jgi:6-phosphogluconate dehydrogenase